MCSEIISWGFFPGGTCREIPHRGHTLDPSARRLMGSTHLCLRFMCPLMLLALAAYGHPGNGHGSSLVTSGSLGHHVRNGSNSPIFSKQPCSKSLGSNIVDFLGGLMHSFFDRNTSNLSHASVSHFIGHRRPLFSLPIIPKSGCENRSLLV